MPDEVIRGHWVYDPETGKLRETEKPSSASNPPAPKPTTVPVVKR